MDRFYRFRLILLVLLLFACQTICTAQSLSSALNASSTSTATLADKPVSLNIEADSQVQESLIEVGQSFHFQVNVSWDGDASLVSLSEPKIEWPKSIRQLDVSTGVRSEASASGPRGSRYFRYELVADKAEAMALPSVRLEVTQEGKPPLTVESPEVRITVNEKKIPFTARVEGQLRKNAVLLIGSLLVVMLGCGVYLLSRNKNSTVVNDQVNPWEGIETELKSMESLIWAGEGRDFFRVLEKVLGDAVAIYQGVVSAIPLQKIEQQVLFPENIRDNVHHLINEVGERKYRPDRPRPEELSVALGQLREIIKQLKDTKPGGGHSK